MTRHAVLRNTILCLALFGAPITVMATPPAHHGGHAADLHAQLKSVDARIATARKHNASLQAQVAQMEQQNAAQQEQLQQRDAEIAALQKKLTAAGAPASAASAGH